MASGAGLQCRLRIVSFSAVSEFISNLRERSLLTDEQVQRLLKATTAAGVSDVRRILQSGYIDQLALAAVAVFYVLLAYYLGRKEGYKDGYLEGFMAGKWRNE